MNTKYYGITDLVNEYAEANNVTKKEARKAVKGVIASIHSSLLKDDCRGIQIIDFLTLEKVNRATRVGRNPLDTSKTYKIPARIRLKCNVGKSLDYELNS